jgi:hypothetical protein
MKAMSGALLDRPGLFHWAMDTADISAGINKNILGNHDATALLKLLWSK